MQRVRWPRSFSVFSGSDSDSDGHAAERYTRSRKPNFHINTSNTSNPERASSVTGVYLFCSGDQVDLSSLQTPMSPPSSRPTPTMGAATVSPSDAIWTATPLPISSLIGIPLLMRRLLAKPSSSLPPSPDFDNELASQLQIDPSNQISDIDGNGSTREASRGLGTVLIVRADRAPLPQDLVERICAFHAKLLGLAHQRGRGSMAEIVKTWATPEKFVAFCTESYQTKSSAPISNSVHQMLNGSWLEVQRPMAAV